MAAADGSIDFVPNPGMDKLLGVVNKLREAFSMMQSEPINLPMIAVVGSQSAGKSSVLENIVGRSFLPRGSGIVTRCPCEIRMHATGEGGEEYGMFTQSDEPGRRFKDFNDIRLKIESETDRLAGERGLTTTPIMLDIYSPHMVDLTLVDLPGAVRTVTEGQDADTPRQIEKMIKSYISQHNCIILAVSAANNDLAVSDAIAMSQQVDPQGLRTLGVLTKLDLMDQGTNARRIITGEDDTAPKLRLGYIGVVNRSQKDITDQRSIADAREKEAQYFTLENPAYRDLANRMGTAHLVERCSEQLMMRIQAELPTIWTKLDKLIDKKKNALKALPDLEPSTLVGLMADMVTAFMDQYRGLIQGFKNNATLDDNDQSRELVGGARIEALLTDSFMSDIYLMEVSEISEAKFRLIMKNTQGLGCNLFMDNDAVNEMFSHEIERFRQPSVSLAYTIFDEMNLFKNTAIGRVEQLGAFPKAQMAVNDVVSRILREQMDCCRDHIDVFVDSHKSRINYKHPEFDGTTRERIQHEVEQAANRRRFGDEENEEEQELLLKFREGQDLSAEEAAKVRGLIDRRHRAAAAADGDQSGPAGGVDTSGGLAAAAAGAGANVLETIRGSVQAMGLSRQSSRDVESERLHAFLSTISPKEKTELEKIVALKRAYFQLAKKWVVDQVPKYIELLMVEHTLKKLEKEVNLLVSKPDIHDMMCPSDDVKIRRDETMATLKKLEEAKTMLFDIGRTKG